MQFIEGNHFGDFSSLQIIDEKEMTYLKTDYLQTRALNIRGIRVKQMAPEKFPEDLKKQ